MHPQAKPNSFPSSPSEALNQHQRKCRGPFDTRKSDPDRFLAFCSRERTRNFSTISCYSGAIVHNSGAIPKSVQSQSSAQQSAYLHVFAFTIPICHENSSKHLSVYPWVLVLSISIHPPKTDQPHSRRLNAGGWCMFLPCVKKLRIGILKQQAHIPTKKNTQSNVNL